MNATEGALIGVGITLGLVVLLSFLNVLRVGFLPAYAQGPTTKTIFDFTFINWFKILYYFLPYGLFLFGIVYDGLIRKIKFFPAGFIGLLAIFINSTLSRIAGLGTTDTDICGIPGMSQWGSDIAPQNIVFTSAILTYIASYLTVNPVSNDFMSVGAGWFGAISVGILQGIVFNMSGCFDPVRWVGGSNIFGRLVVPLLGFVVGGAIGGTSGALIANYVDVGSGLTPAQQQGLLGGTSGPAMAPTTSTPDAGTCSATGDGDQFVCEAYKNGELITSTIVE